MSGDHNSWRELELELAQWRAAGRRASLWWRDDDATTADSHVQRLGELSAQSRVPLSLAVIPARADPSLLDVLRNCPRAAVLQHGYAHVDHGNGAEPAAELGDHRSEDVVLEELCKGREGLRDVVGEYLLPVLVPPWNRISQSLIPQLAGLGFRGLSCFSARQAGEDTHGLSIVNCHVDPVNWRKERVFRGEAKCLSMLIGHLCARRSGEADVLEPTGLLTHHWSHDEETWAFLQQLFERTRGRREVDWLDARQVFCP